MNDMSQVKSKPVDELVALLKRMPSDVLNQAAEIITFTRNDRDDLQSQLTQAERRGEEKAREELKSKARDHVAERCDQIAQLQSQLTQSNELASTLKSQWLSMSTQLTQAHKERDEAVAACAAFRKAIDKSNCADWVDAPSTDCGKAFLERMKEAEWLLGENQKHVGYDGTRRFVRHPANAWIDRRDAWLKGGAK